MQKYVRCPWTSRVWSLQHRRPDPGPVVVQPWSPPLFSPSFSSHYYPFLITVTPTICLRSAVYWGTSFDRAFLCFPLIRSGVRDPFTRRVVASALPSWRSLPSPRRGRVAVGGGCRCLLHCSRVLQIPPVLLISPRLKTTPAAFIQSEWHSDTARWCGSASRWRDVRWGWRIVPPLQKCKSAPCDALTDRIQACADQQRLQVIAHLRLTLPTGSERCLHLSFMYSDIRDETKYGFRDKPVMILLFTRSCWWTFFEINYAFSSQANFARLSFLIWIHSSVSFFQACLLFQWAKTKDAALRTLKVTTSATIPFLDVYIDTWTTCSHCGVKRKWTVWVYVCVCGFQ